METLQSSLKSMIKILQDSHVDWLKSKTRKSLLYDLMLIKSLSKHWSVEALTQLMITNTCLKTNTLKRLRVRHERQQLLLHWRVIIRTLQNEINSHEI